MMRDPSRSGNFNPDRTFTIYDMTLVVGSNNLRTVKEIDKEIGFLSASPKGEERIRFFFHDLSLPPRGDFQTHPLPLEDQVVFTDHLTGFFPKDEPLAWIEAKPGYSRDEAVLASINSLAHLTSCALERAVKTLTFHAAVLVYKNKGLLLLGKSGAGKTTLSMICSREGFTCLTDEWAFLDPAPPVNVRGFSRRLRVYQDVFRAYTNRSSDMQGGKPYEAFGEKGILLDPVTVSRKFYDKPFPLHAILALNNQPELTGAEIIPLGKSHALFELLSTFLGASLREEGFAAKAVNRRGFRSAQELTERFSIYRLNYNLYKTFRDIPALLKGLVR